MSELVLDDMTQTILDLCDKVRVGYITLGYDDDIICIVAFPSLIAALIDTIPKDKQVGLELRADLVGDIFIVPKRELERSCKDNERPMPELWVWEPDYA